MNYSADEILIRQLFENTAKAWDKGDSKLYASYFTDDCDYITFSGDHIRGQQFIAETHQQLFDSFIMKGSALKHQVKNIRFLSDDIAVVHIIGAVKLRFQKKAPHGRQSINTNIVYKQSGLWKITAFHNCRIKKPTIIQNIFMERGNKK